MLRLMWVQDYPFECENSNEPEVSSLDLKDDDAQNLPIHLSRGPEVGLATGRSVVVVSHGLVGECSIRRGALLFFAARTGDCCRKQNEYGARG